MRMLVRAVKPNGNIFLGMCDSREVDDLKEFLEERFNVRCDVNEICSVMEVQFTEDSGTNWAVGTDSSGS